MSWAPFVIPAISVIIAFSAFLFSTRAAHASAAASVHAVDAEAYTRASAIYEDTIASLRTDITSLRADLAGARIEIRELRASNDRMTAELRRLGHTINGTDAGG